MSIRTVADLVAELQKMPQHLPVLVGCHFDNDNGLTYRVNVTNTHVSHTEGEFFYEDDPSNPSAFPAVTVA